MIAGGREFENRSRHAISIFPFVKKLPKINVINSTKYIYQIQ